MVEWTATPATRSTYEDFPPAEPLAPILNDAVSDVLLSYKALAFILVLGLPRTATKATLQFFHKNYADRAKVAHAHGISPRFQKTLFDLVDQEKINAFERVRKLLNIAKRTLIVITLREPVSRIYSYYLYFNRNRIGSFFDPQNQTFSDRGAFRQTSIGSLWRKRRANAFGTARNYRMHSASTLGPFQWLRWLHPRCLPKEDGISCSCARKR